MELKEKNNLNHNIRNPLIGLIVEIKKIAKFISKMEEFITRIDNSKQESIKKWANECTDSQIEVSKS